MYIFGQTRKNTINMKNLFTHKKSCLTYIQLPSFSESELLSELDPLLDPELELLELPLVVLLSDRRDVFGSDPAGKSKIISKCTSLIPSTQFSVNLIFLMVTFFR